MFRSLRQATTSVSRSVAARGTAQRAVCMARPQMQSALWAGAGRVTMARGFSVSARRLGEGSSDVTLTQRLEEELKYEKEAGSDAVPDFVNEFTSQGVWEIQDTIGNDEIALTRKFGNETIRLMFSIADLDNAEPAFEPEEGEENPEVQEPTPSFPIRCSFSITKDSASGALNFDAVCQEGAFLIENISFYNDTKIGTELTAEADWKRRGLYLGPSFAQLDPNVQEEFERFLDERGVNEGLALFVPDYAEYKEQKEYVQWLANVKNFVEK